MSLIPNPASGLATVRVTADRPGPLAVALFDLLGRHVAASEVTAGAGTTTVPIPTEAVRSLERSGPYASFS